MQTGLSFRTTLAALAVGLVTGHASATEASDGRHVQFIVHASEMSFEGSTISISKIESIEWVGSHAPGGHGKIETVDFRKVLTSAFRKAGSGPGPSAVIVELGREKDSAILRLKQPDKHHHSRHKDGSGVQFGYEGIAGTLIEIEGELVMVTGPVPCPHDIKGCPPAG